MSSTQLPRRAIVGTVLAASIVGGGVVAFAAGEGGGLGLPTKDCNTVTDPKGDGNVGSQEGLPGSFPNDPDLDITGLVFGSNDKALTAYLRLDKLADRSQYGDGHAFSASFTANGKVVDFTTFRLAAGQVNDGMASLPAPLTIRSSYVKVAGSSTAVPFTATYDTTNSMVILSADRAGLEKAIGGPIATISKIGAESDTDIADLSEPADLAEGKDVTWAADSNACFGGAAPAPVTSVPSETPSTEPSPAPAPPAAGAPAAGGAPLADCFTAKDPKGDAKYNGQTIPPSPNDPDMDILGLTLGTTADALVGYFKVDKLAAGPDKGDGHRFAVNFTFNKHNFTASGSSFKDAPAGQLRDGLSATGRIGKVTQLAVDGGPTIPTDPAGAQAAVAGPGFVDSKLKYTFDVKTSIVTMSLPLADIEKYGKAPTAGATLSAVFASAAADSSTLSFPYDTVPDGGSATASKLTYAIGDNPCFGAAAPAVSPLSSVGAVKAQYGDVAAVAAKLVDAAGAPVAGKTVTFTVGSSKVTGTTGADGVAKGALTVKEKAGKRSLVITSDDAKASVDFIVSVEKTALKAVGGKGGVTATLTDDDKKPVAGQVITFASGSKKVTSKTDAKGVAKATGLPPGNIKVAYAGAAGMYTAASTTTKA